MRRAGHRGAAGDAAIGLLASEEATMPTGSKCPRSGHYGDTHGHEIVISAGDTFPPCPVQKVGTTWRWLRY